jgi:hypothetical protein
VVLVRAPATQNYNTRRQRAVVWQFVSDVEVVWPAQAWLGVPYRRWLAAA